MMGSTFCTDLVVPPRWTQKDPVIRIEAPDLDCLRSGWWFPNICFFFTPKIGEMIPFDEHIFQMGWNHQPDGKSPFFLPPVVLIFFVFFQNASYYANPRFNSAVLGEKPTYPSRRSCIAGKIPPFIWTCPPLWRVILQWPNCRVWQ